VFQKTKNNGRNKRASTTSGKDIFLQALSPLSTKPQSKRSEQYPRAKAKFSYTAADMSDTDDEENSELSFAKDDIIVVLDKTTDPQGWWKGSLNGQTGLFPHNYVEIIEESETNEAPALPKRTSSTFAPSKPLPKKIPDGWILHKATWSFDKTEDEEMSFQEGELILVEEKSIEEAKDQTEGDIFWWLGRRWGKGNDDVEKGFVPSSYLVRVV